MRKCGESRFQAPGPAQTAARTPKKVPDESYEAEGWAAFWREYRRLLERARMSAKLFVVPKER